MAPRKNGFRIREDLPGKGGPFVCASCDALELKIVHIKEKNRVFPD